MDLFFDAVPVHADAARNRQFVPFDGEQIPVLGPTELAVFKAMFDRTRDGADIEGDNFGRDPRHDAVRTTLADHAGR